LANVFGILLEVLVVVVVVVGAVVVVVVVVVGALGVGVGTATNDVDTCARQVAAATSKGIQKQTFILVSAS